MSNSKATKSEIKSLKLRIATLEAELAHPFTIKCGPAAIKCVSEDLALAKATLAARS